MYDEWGQRIASGQLFSERPFFLDPLYPYFLGAVFALFGHHYEAVAAIQGLLGAMVPPLVFLGARSSFDLPSARLAGLIAAVYLPSIYFGGLLMKPAMSLFLVALALWLLSRALAGAHRVVWLSVGLVFGLACLTRGNLVLIVPVLALWILLRSPNEGAAPDEPFRKRWLERSRWIEAGAFVLGTALIFVFPAAHNYRVGGEWILSTANAGANFYIGNNPGNDTGEYQELPFVSSNPKYEQRDFAREAERRSGRSLSDREISRFWFGESWKWIREEPAAWSRLMGRKLHSFWGAFEIPDTQDYYLYRKTAPLLRMPLPGFGLLAPLGLLGAALALRRRGWPRLLLVFVIAYSCSIVLFFVFSRFRMVIVPALFVFAGFGALELVRRWRAAIREQAGFPQAIWATGLLIAFFAFVNLPVRAMVDSWSYRLASAVGLPTRVETSAIGRHNLGVSYAALAKQAEQPEQLLQLAEAELRESLRLDPSSARVHIELGKVLSRRGRNREAIAIYEKAASITPYDYRIHFALGVIHRRLGETEAAEGAYRRALRVAPRHVASATGLGDVLLETGRADEAAELYRYALRLAPDNAAAREGLRAAEGR